MDNCRQSGSFDELLVRILFKISQNLKKVQIQNRFDFDEITLAYKKAVFNSDKILGETIEFADLNNFTQLVDFYKRHSLCWVNYIACDYYSTKRKKQVFFSSIFDKHTNEAQDFSKKYTLLLSEKKPVDIFVQLFFINEDQLKNHFVELKQKGKGLDDSTENILLSLFEKIQRNGLVIPFELDSHNDDIEDYPVALKLGETIQQIGIENIDALDLGEIKDFNLFDGIISILKIINQGSKEVSDYSLFKKVAQLNRCLHDDVKFLYFVPADGPDGAIGLFCYGAKEKLNGGELNRLKLLAYNILFPFVSAYKSAKERLNTYRESTKSAKSAIMSRNMSHNLGSHVMSYLKNHLSSVQSVLSDRVLSKLIENDGDLSSIVDIKKLNVDQLTLPFLVGLGQFISYLQERQDFIATIATDYIPYYSTVNFKDSIYDELNNDKRFERHQDRKNLKPDNILLGNIARSEGLGRQTCPTSGDDSKLRDIVIKFRTTFTGDPVEIVSVSPSNVPDAEEKKAATPPPIQPTDFYGDQKWVDIAKEELKEMRKYEVSLPGGIVGRQAVFSIFENVIRNAAKHGNWRKQGRLELTIDIFSKDEVLFNRGRNLDQRLRDDRVDNDSLSLKEVLSMFYCTSEEIDDDYFFVTLTDNLHVNPDSLKSLRLALIENYIDEDSSRMKDANKGIKEMRISAAWLRSIYDDIALSPFDESNYELGDRLWLTDGKRWDKRPPVLYARLSKDKDDSCNLQYIFCLMRSKKVAFVSPSFSGHISLNEVLFKENGWRLFSPHDYLTCKNKSYEIVVCDDAVTDDDFRQIRLLSPKRFIKLSELQNKGVFNKIVGLNDKGTNKSSNITGEELDEALISLYEHLSGWKKEDNEMIFIQDPKAQYNYERLEEKKKSDRITFSERANAKYRYVTHLEVKNQFLAHVINSSSSTHYLFSEGITGDNSTDRLVRNEELTDLWFFKHLYAMKQKVAIFDERIFSKVYGLEENDMVISPIEHYGEDLDEDKKALKNRFSLDEEQLKRLDSLSDYDSFRMFVDLMNYDPQKGMDIKEAINARNHLGATFVFKNLYIFSIIRSLDNPEKFNIIGFQNAPETENFSQCKKYGTLEWDVNNKKLKFDTEKKMNFSLMSIHQGLLDKLYGVFKIKKDDIQAKENLTKSLYEKFIGGNPDSYRDGIDKHYILPGMTIHSGRSKPGKDDMPQWIPFIPYSAIEHAVLDCKYSLVELLDSARYE